MPAALTLMGQRPRPLFTRKLTSAYYKGRYIAWNSIVESNFAELDKALGDPPSEVVVTVAQLGQRQLRAQYSSFTHEKRSKIFRKLYVGHIIDALHLKINDVIRAFATGQPGHIVVVVNNAPEPLHTSAPMASSPSHASSQPFAMADRMVHYEDYHGEDDFSDDSTSNHAGSHCGSRVLVKPDIIAEHEHLTALDMTAWCSSPKHRGSLLGSSGSLDSVYTEAQHYSPTSPRNIDECGVAEAQECFDSPGASRKRTALGKARFGYGREVHAPVGLKKSRTVRNPAYEKSRKSSSKGTLASSHDSHLGGTSARCVALGFSAEAQVEALQRQLEEERTHRQQLQFNITELQQILNEEGERRRELEREFQMKVVQVQQLQREQEEWQGFVNETLCIFSP